jgi:hypothetical protein
MAEPQYQDLAIPSSFVLQSSRQRKGIPASINARAAMRGCTYLSHNGLLVANDAWRMQDVEETGKRMHISSHPIR